MEPAPGPGRPRSETARQAILAAALELAVRDGYHAVTIKGIAFNPKEVHVKVGQQLVWNWEDGGLEHTVTADDKSFDSGRKSSGSWSPPQPFTKAGTIAYHCEIHRQMHGTVAVG